MSRPGMLGDLKLCASERRFPGPGEIEIEVCALGLNLREVLKALGLYGDVQDVERSSITFGGDCAGRVLSVGPGVERFRPGDEVLAFGSDVFGSFVTLPAACAARKPRHLGFEDAATIPIAFLTAYYSLYTLARLRKGESVLIHAASGGVGLAAVQLCHLAGARIFATAGSERKREFLRGLGIEHVLNSRSLEFADQILAVTKNAGVDVVLNSLAGEFIEKSLSVLGPFGRFLEIGKRDIQENTRIGLAPFRKNLSFFAIDLEQMSNEFLSSLMDELLVRFENGELRPLEHQVFPISNVVDAFRYMRKAAHIGKIVISFEDTSQAIRGCS
jgi:NADPH:quinone reductase-like Zn-dependent oxidoreductase